MKKKILIFTPNEAIKGGVSNFYSIAKKLFSDKFICTSFNYFRYEGPWKPLVDIANFFVAVFKILVYRPACVVVNPSLGRTAIIRDGLLLIIIKMFEIKTVVFWRGWSPNNETILEDNF